jgi:hypothetical protein
LVKRSSRCLQRAVRLSPMVNGLRYRYIASLKTRWLYGWFARQSENFDEDKGNVVRERAFAPSGDAIEDALLHLAER